MSKLLFVGECYDPLYFLNLCDQQKYYVNQSIGQLVSVPGKGIQVRKNMPELEQISPEEAMETADYIIAFQEEAQEFFNVKKPVFTIEQCLKRKPQKSRPAAHAVSVEYHPDDFSAALDMVKRLRMKGYYVNCYSTDIKRNKLIYLFDPPVCNADLDLYLEPSEECTDSPCIYENSLLKTLQSRVPKRIYIARMCGEYQAEWSNSVHMIAMRENHGLYFTGTKQTLCMNKDQYRLFRALNVGMEGTMMAFSREELEYFCILFRENAAADRYYRALISTHHAKIANENDVILSFLGSRRCNMRCSYCFSDHTCEKLSDMTPEDTASVIDMVTANCPEDAKVHFDNNLGGEPLMDFGAVKKRHLLALGYHHVTGIPASFGLLTNGTLLDKEHLDWLRFRLPYIGFSLDGDEATHDKIRRDFRLAPTYKQAVHGIELVKDIQWPVETGISTVLTKYNLDVTGLENHFRDELDVHHVVMKPVRAAETEDYALTYEDIPALREEYEKFFNFLMESALEDNLDPLFTMLQPLDYAARFLLRTFWADRVVVKRCGAGEIIFSADDHGRVYPCDSFNGVEDKELGNLESGMHNRSHFQIPYVTEKPECYHCDTCWARFLCGGICEYVTHINGYQYNDVLKMECEFSRILIELSLSFWMNARCTWSEETMAKVEDYIISIGYPRLPYGSFVYAPC